jgi:hypothetical protein
MQELFREQQKQDARWFADASAPDRPAPRDTLKPPSDQGTPTPELPPAPAVPRDPPVWDGSARDSFVPAPRPPSPNAPSSTASSVAPLRPSGHAGSRALFVLLLAAGVAAAVTVAVILASR